MFCDTYPDLTGEQFSLTVVVTFLTGLVTTSLISLSRTLSGESYFYGDEGIEGSKEIEDDSCSIYPCKRKCIRGGEYCRSHHELM